MTREELLALIAEVQSRRSELDTVEVKTAKGGTPKRLYESLSAFANRLGYYGSIRLSIPIKNLSRILLIDS